MTSFSELEDTLAADTDELLASETITVHRLRTQGTLSATDRSRALDVDSEAEAVSAINSERYTTRNDSSQRIVVTMWEILAAGLTFTPSPTGKVVAEDGTVWKISRVENILSGRKIALHCVKDR